MTSNRRWLCTIACSILLSTVGAVEAEPARVTMQCMPWDGQALVVRFGSFDPHRRLVLRLWGKGLAAAQRNELVNIPRVAIGGFPDPAGVGDAKLCPPVGQQGNCSAVSASIKFATLDMAPGGVVGGVVNGQLSHANATSNEVADARQILFNAVIDRQLAPCG